MLNLEARKEKRIQRKHEEKGIWKNYFRLLFKAKLPWVWLIVLVILNIGYNWIVLQFPQYVQQISAGDISKTVIIGAIAVIVARVFSVGIVGYITSVVKFKVDMSYRNLIWHRLVKSPMSLFDKVKPNEMVSRTVNDTSNLSDTLTVTFPAVIATVYSLGYVFNQFMDYDWRLAASFVVYAPIYVAFNIWYGKWNYRTNKETQNRLASLTQFLSELLVSIPLIKSFSTEKKEDKRGKEHLQDYYKASMKRNMVNWAFGPLAGILDFLMNLFVIVFGIYLVTTGAITIDVWIAFFLYVAMLFGQFSVFSTLYSSLKVSQGATARIALLVDGELEQYDRSESITTANDDLVFDNVNFSYGDKKVLEDVSFKIPHGKRTAIVGPSGCGKSTILALIQQLYTPTSGTIRFGDNAINQFHLSDWRKLFSHVTQDSALFNGTIRENILYGVNHEVSEFELAEAAKAADALKFIKESPNGFETEVGENGVNLSGGQRQRITIARAILRNADILLLDEAMVGLDGQSEKVIQTALDTLMVGKTSVVVAHDLSTIRSADQIILINEGKVEVTGTHEQLMVTSELYQQFVRYLTQASVG